MYKKIIENRRCPFNTVTDTKIMWALLWDRILCPLNGCPLNRGNPKEGFHCIRNNQGFGSVISPPLP